MLQWYLFSLSKTLPTTQIINAIQDMSDLCELDFGIFELNFWYQVQFCALLAAIFSKPDAIFILFDMELSSKNKEMGYIDIKLLNKRPF